MAHPARIGRFIVIEFLGQGSMGVVYRGRDETLERDVALKVMSLAQSADEDARARFRREALAAARLQHPNIVTIYELGVHRDAPFIAMELLEGMDLARAIDAGLRPDPRATLPIILQVLAGLGHAHDQGVVHRDIKPSNVFLPRALPAKIMDFGVARLVGAASTSSGIVGSPSYMSPEQVHGGPIDGRSDLFSVGLILYELVTGERAFKASSVAAVLYKIINESPDFSSLPQAEEWRSLRTVLQRSLAREASERYTDARAMASDLAQALIALGGSSDWASASDRGLLVRVTPRPRPGVTIPLAAPEQAAAPSDAVAPRPMPRRWPLMVLAALGFIALSIGLGLLFISRSPSPPIKTISTATTIQQGIAASPHPEPSARQRTPLPVASPVEIAIPTAVPPTPTKTNRTTTPMPTMAASPQTSPSPSAGSGSLERAEAFFAQGHFQRAMNEARAVLSREPTNEAARSLLEDSEAALVVETRLQKARAAMQKGDKDTALEEVRAGLAVAPNDARLMRLFRELTSD